MEPDPPQPPTPTAHPPGTLGKLRTMCQRQSAGLDLYHPADADGGNEARLPNCRNSGPATREPRAFPYHGPAVPAE